VIARRSPGARHQLVLLVLLAAGGTAFAERREARVLELQCPSGPMAFDVAIIGLSVLNRAEDGRTTLSLRTLLDAQAKLDGPVGRHVLEWQEPDGSVRALHPEALLRALCGAAPRDSASQVGKIATAVAGWCRAHLEERCGAGASASASAACRKALEISAGPGVRG
jgi:hypothetical protein